MILPKTDDDDIDIGKINEEVAEVKPDKSQYTPEVQALVDSANVARDEFNAANNAYNDLNYDIQVRCFKFTLISEMMDVFYLSYNPRHLNFSLLPESYKGCFFERKK